ncbi:unnamed protein product [Sphacelaria rigidula]
MRVAAIEVCAAFGLHVAENNAVTAHLCSPNMKADEIEVEAADQKYKQVEPFAYPGGKIGSIGDVIPEIHSRVGFAVGLFVTLKANVIEVMLYGCVTRTIAHDNFGALREAHQRCLLRCLDKHISSRSAPDYHILPYHEISQRPGCECMEATAERRILMHAGCVLRTHDERLPNIVMSGVMVGGKTKAGRPARRYNTVSRNTSPT